MTFPVGGYADLPASVVDGLISYWPFSESVGRVVKDVVANQDILIQWQSGDLLPSVGSVIAGMFGNARTLRTTTYTVDTNYFTTGDSKGAAGALDSGATYENYTLVFRWNPHSPPAASSGWPSILKISASGVSDVGYIDVTYGGIAGGDISKIVFTLGWVDPILHEIEATAPAVNTWHTIAVVGDSVAGETRAYVNGSLVGSVPIAPLKHLKDTIALGNAAHGDFDDMAIWDRVLSLAELQDVGASAVVPSAIETGESYPVAMTYVGSQTYMRDLTYANGIWMQIESRLVTGTLRELYIQKSVDGTTWTRHLVVDNTLGGTMSNTTARLWYGGGKWVVTYYAGFNVQRLFVSSDNGDTWVENTNHGFGTRDIQYALYHDGEWTFVGAGAQLGVVTDPADTITLWSIGLGTFLTFSGLATNGAGVWVMHTNATTGNIYLSTDDRVSWVSVNANLSALYPPSLNTKQYWQVTYVAGRFIVAANGGRLYTSNDGTNWDAQFYYDETGVYSRTFWNVSFIDGNYLAFGSNAQGAGFFRATNPTETWEPQESLPDWSNGFVATDGTRILLAHGGSWLWDVEVPLVETVTTAMVDVEVNVSRPIVTAATVAIATIAAMVGVITGTVREAEIDVPVGVTADAQGKLGAGNLLLGLTAYWAMEDQGVSGNAVTPDLHNDYDAEMGFTRLLDGGWEDFYNQPFLSGKFAAFPDRAQGLFGGAWASSEVRVDNFVSLPSDFTISVWQYRMIPYGSETTHWPTFYGYDAPIVNTRKDRIRPSFVFSPTLGDPNYFELRMERHLVYVGSTPTYPGWRLAVKARPDSIGIDVDEDNNHVFEYSEEYFPEEEWLHIVARRRKDVLDVFVNGVLKLRVPGVVGNLAPAGGTWQFGRAKYGNETNADVMWGALDEIGVWDIALLDSEIQRLYSNGQPVEYPFTSIGEVDATIGVTPRTDLRVDYRDFGVFNQTQHFIGVLTGAEDSLEDVTLPLVSWRVERRPVGKVSALFARLEGVTPETEAAIAARPNGRLLLRSMYTTGGYTWTEDFASAPVSEKATSRTPTGKTLRLAGYDPVVSVLAQGTQLLRGVQSVQVSGGVRRMSAEMNMWVHPGSLVEFEGQSFEVDSVVYYANPSGQLVMEVSTGG